VVERFLLCFWKSLKNEIGDECGIESEVYGKWRNEKMSEKRTCDINGIMRRAEHEISYFAKRAIEEYYSHWQASDDSSYFNGEVFYRNGDYCKVNCCHDIFIVIAKGHCLTRGQIESLERLMKEFGMM
jgi:hypothetical protein